jgi:hypothetical protein
MDGEAVNLPTVEPTSGRLPFHAYKPATGVQAEKFSAAF